MCALYKVPFWFIKGLRCQNEPAHSDHVNPLSKFEFSTVNRNKPRTQPYIDSESVEFLRPLSLEYFPLAVQCTGKQVPALYEPWVVNMERHQLAMNCILPGPAIVSFDDARCEDQRLARLRSTPV